MSQNVKAGVNKGPLFSGESWRRPSGLVKDPLVEV